jgi:type IV secretory pathway TrbD component
MGNLSVDPLAIAALVGFVILIAIGVGITIWFVKQAYKAPEAPQISTPDE